MSVHSGPADWWTQGTDAGRKHVATKGVVQTGLVLNLDAGVSDSYPGSGTTWTDLSGNSNNGTLTNGPTFSSDNGGSLILDGVNEHITIPSNANFDISTGDYTIDGWYYPNTLDNGQTALSLGTPRSSLFWVLRPAGVNGSIFFGTGSGSWGWTQQHVTSNNLVSANSWVNVVVLRNGTTLRIYVNSILVSEVPSFNFGSGQSGTLYIGTYFVNTNNDGSWFEGKISNLKFYKGKSYTAQEIRQNFNATRGRYGI